MHVPCSYPGTAVLHSSLRANLRLVVARAPALRGKPIVPAPRPIRVNTHLIDHQVAGWRSTAATSAWSLLLPEAAQAVELAPVLTAELAVMGTGESIWWPLLLSTLAGMSTAVGGLLAVSFSPSESTLALLLGTAIGVMATVSGVELWWHSAVEQHDFIGVSAAVAAGAILFAILDRLLPDHGEHHDKPVLAAAADIEQQQDQGFGSIDVRQLGNIDGENGNATSESNGNGRGSGSNLLTESSKCSIHSTRTAGDLALDRAPLLQGLQLGSNDQDSNCTTSSSSRCSTAVSNRDQACHDEAEFSDTDDVWDISAAQPHLLPVGSLDKNSTRHSSSSVSGAHATEQQQQQQQKQQAHRLSIAVHNAPEEQQLLLRAKHAGMLRLGLLMMVTLTVHNLPEGFAVAFSAYTDIGPIMALAIALHNIPEGLVIAAPLYAATGSKVKALGMTAASGLSEPVGALLALLVFKPFMTSTAQLDYVLAVTGGVMLAVCVLELWPEGMRCGHTATFIQGIALGTVIMGWTLYMGV